jgi:hypothetical protein
VGEPEDCDGLQQLLRLFPEATGRVGTLLDERRVLLGSPIHLADGFANLRDTRTLFGTRSADLAEEVGYTPNRSHDI